LTTSAPYLTRGIEPYLHSPRCARPGASCGAANVTGWGTVGNYLSHLTLLEHVAARVSDASADDAALVLQDDVELFPGWRQSLRRQLFQMDTTRWTRLQLVWFGAEREADCTAVGCAVHPPAGPTSDGKRFYHGLQAYLIRPSGARCLVERLRTLQIKSIDALMVQADCPGSYAVRKGQMLGFHTRGSQKAKLDMAYRRAGGRRLAG